MRATKRNLQSGLPVAVVYIYVSNVASHQHHGDIFGNLPHTGVHKETAKAHLIKDTDLTTHLLFTKIAVQRRERLAAVPTVRILKLLHHRYFHANALY